MRKYKIKPVETRLKIKRSLKKTVTNRHCLKFSKKNNNKKIHLKISWNDTKRMKCHENQLYFRFIWESFLSLSLDVLSCNIQIPFFRKCFICSSVFKLCLWYIFREVFSRHREQNCRRFSSCFHPCTLALSNPIFYYFAFLR